MAIITRTTVLRRSQQVSTKEDELLTATEDISGNYKETDTNRPSRTSLTCMRVACVGVTVLCYLECDRLQEVTNILWAYLCSTWVYNCVYFETWWATICYGLILSGPYLITKTGLFQRYTIDPTLKWQSAGVKKVVLEAIEYCTPLMLIDTFTVKKYHGVEPEEWEVRAQGYIQYTRALPPVPPSVFQIFYQLVVSFVIYDLIFFAVHFALHKNLWLYKTVHAAHHDHSLVHSRVTNQLSVTERITLVLSANQALKMVQAHPLTRTIFVPLFIAMLVENHCGYDLPFTLDKIVPFGLFGGSAQHHKHHTHGSRNYQPFFTYIDKALAMYSSWKNKRNKVVD